MTSTAMPGELSPQKYAGMVVVTLVQHIARLHRCCAAIAFQFAVPPAPMSAAKPHAVGICGNFAMIGTTVA
jgi:hypothetical protein